MNINQIAQIGALVGEPARTAMLVELMGGRALTAGELAGAARVSPQTASRHLALLVDAGLLALRTQGRHRYHRLASPQVARLLEQIMQLAAAAPPDARRPVVTGPRDAALRTARTCYDHLAGRLGVAIAERLCADGAVVLEGEAAEMTGRCAAALRALGIGEAQLASLDAGAGRAACRPCLDWSERRWHLAGRLGALICSHCLERGWLRRASVARAVHISPAGQAALRGWLGLALWREVEQGGNSVVKHPAAIRPEQTQAA